MTLKTLIENYLNKETTAIEAIRMISGMFNPEQAVDLLVLVNQITRHEQGDIDSETFKKIYGMQ